MSAPAAGHPLHALDRRQRSAPEPLHPHKPLPAQGTRVMSARAACWGAHKCNTPYERHARREAVCQRPLPGTHSMLSIAPSAAPRNPSTDTSHCPRRDTGHVSPCGMLGSTQVQHPL